ncbi:MAG: crotonase/enoyl-CoA hydratase family protein [Methyloligellaceae bacterium]
MTENKLQNNSIDMSENMGRIVTERSGRIFLIGIDRPQKYNGFTPKMLLELAQAYTDFEQDEDTWCAVLWAQGDHFSAGLQLSEFKIGQTLIRPGLIDPLGLHQPFRTKPVVCAVQGICYTIGIELMLASDVVIAEDGTRFRQLEVNRGLMAYGGATIRFVERAGWGNAMRYLLTGDEFGPEMALHLNFVQEVTAVGEAKSRALEIAETITRQAPLAVQATRANSMLYAQHGQQAAVAAFPEQLASLSKTEDFAEGVQSFIERRDGNFKGR